MIGVIGVAPEKGKSVPCGYPGSHGGNLDCKLMVKGNTAYFPVRVEGGLVQMYEEALRHASVQMQGLVAAATGWDATDAYLYMSLRGDLEVCQACKPCEVDLIVRLGVPKADMKRPLVG